MKKTIVVVVASAIAIALPVRARAAVTFPPDSAFVAWRCGNGPMTDPVGDDPPFLTYQDLVGDGGSPAGLRAADATNIYFRIRLDQDPTNGNVLHASSWGYAIDLDGDLATYELLVVVDGIGSPNAINVFTNHTTTMADSLADPADTPPAASFPFAQNGRVVAAASSLGGNADFFLDFAVPWSALVPLGMDRATAIHVWAASSSLTDALDGDVACWNETTMGAATASGAVSATTAGDPGSAGGGGGPGQLQGTECAIGGGGMATLAIVLAVLLVRRRRVALPAKTRAQGRN